MPTSNPWLNPYQRSYNAIKEQLKDSLRSNAPEITDYSEGNLFIILLSMFAAVAEVIHYYIDNLARETFFSSCRRYSSLFKHAKLVDYHIKAAIPASVDLTLFTKNGQDLEANIIIPNGTVFNSTDGKSWVVTAPNGILWDKNLYPKSIKVPVVQKETLINQIYFGQIISTDTITISVVGIPEGKSYVEGSMILTIDGEAWELVDTFAYSGPNDKVYKVELDNSLTPQIVFGDGTFGAKPSLNGEVYGTFEITYGSQGNISESTFNTMPTIAGVSTTNIGVTNKHSASGGSNYEDFATLKEHIPLSVKTLGVAITKEDFEAIAELVGGVDKAYAEYICGKEVNIYITPDNGSITASQALIDQVTQVLNKAKVITTNITVLPVYEARLYLDIAIHGRKSFKVNDIRNQVVNALQNTYGYGNSELGKSIRLSDIYALIDGLTTVDYLTINRVYVVPVPELLSSETPSLSPDLDITTINQISYNNESDFIDVYVTIGESGYTLFIGENEYECYYNVLEDIEDPNVHFQININNNNYNEGDRYRLYLGKMNQNIEPRGEVHYRTIPIFVNRTDTLILDIHESI